jgi:lipoprotein-releasing system permease protein
VNFASCYIAARFLIANKRAMGLSLLGVTAGVGLFIAALAQTRGFEVFYISTILGSEGSVVIADRFQEAHTRILDEKPGQQLMVANRQERKLYPGIADAYRIIDVLSNFSQVVACSPIVEGSAFVKSGFTTEAVSLQGIDLELHLKSTDFGKQIYRGSLDDFRDNLSGICLGSVLAERMRLSVGQSVYIVGPTGDTRRFRIDVIYETGVWAFDTKNVFVHSRSAQMLLNKPYFTSFMIVKLKNPDRAPEIAEEFQDLLSHSSASWQERQKGNLQIFKTLRLSASLVVSMVILLSGFGIFNILSISVIQRTKEIAILRSMGYRQGDISGVFLWQGVMIAVLGVLMGWVSGALLTFLISKVRINLRGALKTDYFIVEWSASHYLLAAVFAFIAVLIAAYVPARRAASLEPAGVLRGTGQ